MANATVTVTLADFPDDILLLVTGHFETARDLRVLAVSCRRLHQFVEDVGWRLFVRKSFPSLVIPDKNTESWRKLAESLTWQSRCWDRRSLRFSALLPRHLLEAGPFSQGRNNMSLFHTVLDVRDDVSVPGREVLAWGEGEKVVVRFRNRRAGPVRMARMQGGDQACRYEPGRDDVRALSLLDAEAASHHGAAVLVGRQNGDLTVLSAAEDGRFGTVLGRFDTGLEPTRRAISGLDLLRRGGDTRVAVATGSGVLVYGMDALQQGPGPGPGPGSAPLLFPSASWTLPTGDADRAKAECSRAVWMADGKALALGLHASSSPLRFLSASPSGWISTSAAKLDSPCSTAIYAKLCPFSLQAVTPSALLSAWKDGTCRLQDMRTPSAFDAVFYQDNINPSDVLEQLLTFGTDRFVGAGMSAPTLKVFDLRWPRVYYHTTALPCASGAPFPAPPQPFLNAPPRARAVLAAGVRPRCNHSSGSGSSAARCRWHELSRDLYYRPNANIYLGHALPWHRGRGHGPYRTSGVWSLARASDLAPNFYAGLSGGVVEGALSGDGGEDPNFGFLADPCDDEEADAEEAGTDADGEHPNFSSFRRLYDAFEDPEAGYRLCRLPRYSLMETGDGLAERHNDRSIRLPPLMHWDDDAVAHGERDVHNRLDWRLVFGVDRDGYIRRRWPS